MADTVIAAAQRIYPANNGPSGTALARDDEIFNRDGVKQANFVVGGFLNTSGGSLAVTLDPLTVFIDGRQVLQVEGGSYGWSLPAASTRWILVQRDGDVIMRDSATVDTANEIQLWRVDTDGTGVTSKVDLRRLNQFTEIGVNSGEFIFLSSDRTKYLYYNSGTGRITIVGDLEVDRILGLPEPIADDEAATRQFVISQAVKVAKAATTANITLSGTQTIDGIAVGVGDVVLVRAQTTGSENGLYTVAAGAWTRHGSMDTSAEAITGLSVYVAQGTVNGQTIWVLSTTGAIVLDTTALVFTKIAGLRLDEIRAPTADIDMDGRKFTDMGAPVAATDSVRLQDIGGSVMSTLRPFTFLVYQAVHAITGLTSPIGVRVAMHSSGVVVLLWKDSGGLKSVRSADFGQTWGSAVVIDAGALATTPNEFDIACIDANNFAVAYKTTTTQIKLAKTSNGGTSWTTANAFAPAAMGAGDKITIICPSSTLYIIGYCNSANGRVRRSTDSGGSWSAEINIFTGNASQGIILFALNTSVILAAAAHYNVGSSALRYNKSTDGGATWLNTTGNTVIAQGDTSASQSAIALYASDANTFYVTWFSGETKKTVETIRSTDGGSTWPTVITHKTTDSGCRTADDMRLMVVGSRWVFLNQSNQARELYQTQDAWDSENNAQPAVNLAPDGNPPGTGARRAMLATDGTSIYEAFVRSDQTGIDFAKAKRVVVAE